MRRHAKAMSAGSNSGQASRLGSFFRGAFAIRGASGDIGGSGAPAYRGRSSQFLVLLCLVVTAAMALTAAPAFAAKTHPYTGTSFGPDGAAGTETFSSLQGVAVDQASGNVYAYDAGAGKVYKFDSAGEPVNFSALTGNAIEGAGGAGAGEGELAVAPGGSPGGTAGDLYVANPSGVSIYSPAGEKLGELKGGETCGVATDPAGHVFIGVYPRTIREYTPSANPPVPGDLSGTSSADLKNICNVAADGLGNLYAATYSGGVFKLEGLSDPSAVAVDPTATTLAIDPSTNDLYADRRDSVAQYSSSGALLGAFGFEQLAGSNGVSINGASGKVYVGDGASGKVAVFGPAAIAPDATTETASQVQRTSATLKGTVGAAGGPQASCQFQYTPEASFQSEGFKGATSAPCAPVGPFTGTSANAVKADIGGLSVETTYRFRVVGTNENGISPGQPLTFKTLPPVNITTGTASNITRVGAALNGTVNPEGIELQECFFEFGETEAYGQVLPCLESPATIGSGESVVPVHANVSGLSANTPYHFRLAAKNSLGESKGADSVFPSNGPPRIEGESFSGVTPTEATVTGLINPGGEATSYVVEYVSAADYDVTGFDNATSVPAGGEVIGASADYTEVTQLLTGLIPETSYRFRFVATNLVAPSVQGLGRLFTTFGAPDASLPDGRAYEMVSPPKKVGEVFPARRLTLGGSCNECIPGINAPPPPTQSTPDGGAIVYGGQPFSVGLAADVDQYLSRRGPDGWQTQNLSGPTFGHSPKEGFKAFTPDLSRGVFAQLLPTLSSDAPVDFPNLYFTDASGMLQPLVADTPQHRSPGRYSSFTVIYGGGNSGTVSNPAFGHVIFEANDALTETTPFAPPAPEIAEGENCEEGQNCNLYEWVDGQLRLINVLPGNTAVAAGAVLGSGCIPSAALLTGCYYQNNQVDHAISADGLRIFWSDASGQAFVRIEGKETREIHDSGVFLDASTDGSKILLNDGCLYDLQAETCEDLTAGEGGFVGMVGASEDFSRIYFVDTAVLTGSEENANGERAEAGEENLYAWNEGAVTFIATLAAGDSQGSFGVGIWAPSLTDRTAQASRDGRYLAFMSAASLTGYDNSLKGGGQCRSSSTSACTEVFEYDADSASLTCASCNPAGQQPLGPANLSLFGTHANLAPPANLPADGQGRLFFESQDVLSSADANGHIQDVYQWEPSGVGSCERPGGCLSLISSGKSANDSHFANATPGGDDAFIITREQLVPRDRDQLLDLYDARVGGGFDEAVAPLCLGEACKGPNSSAPAQQSPGSSTFSGPGNQKQKAHKHKQRHKKKQKHKRGQKRSAKHNSGGSK